MKGVDRAECAQGDKGGCGAPLEGPGSCPCQSVGWVREDRTGPVTSRGPDRGEGKQVVLSMRDGDGYGALGWGG